MNMVSGTTHSGRWRCVPSEGHMSPCPTHGLWPHLRDQVPRGAVFTPREPQRSPGAVELQEPSATSSMHLVLARMTGPDSARLLRWAQPQRVGDRGQAGESALRTPLSTIWATAPSSALLTMKAVFVVHRFLLTWADVSVPCTAAVHLAAMSVARRHSPSAGALHPPPGVLSIHIPLGRKCWICKSRRTSFPSTFLEKTACLGAEGLAGLRAELQDGAVPRQRACDTTGSGQMG